MPETAPEDPALANEEARLRIERLRLENAAMAAEAARPFWDIRARGLIQAGIGGVVAGALVYAFLRDNVATIENLRARGERLQISQQEVSETLVDLYLYQGRLINPDRTRLVHGSIDLAAAA
ncbi:MAG: hypothetical protein AAF908_02140 [Pseudomonadota bacterium]